MATTYTVKKGDTLSELAVKFNTTVSELARLNNIKNVDLIYVGQVLKLSGEATKQATNNTNRAVITAFGFQSNSTNTLFAVWTWDKSNTENYEAKWTYSTGDGVWFIGSNSTTEDKQSTYNYPDNAVSVRFNVKPISKTHTVNDVETSYWTASWSNTEVYDPDDAPPKVPSTPSVTLDKYKLTAKLENLDVNATHIQFQIVKDDKTVFNTGKSKIVTNSASYSCTVTAGSQYKVRCRSMRGSLKSDWSEYSSNAGTIPAAPSGITTLKATSKTSIYLEWPAVKTATSYDIEYATKKTYFDGSDQTSTKTGIEYTHFELGGLESGHEYFFRVRAVNDDGYSGWSGIKSVVIGTDPAAPTTWSSTTTAIVGEELKLYWVHNAEDGSDQTYADLELYVNGVKESYTIEDTRDEDDRDEALVYTIDTTEYDEGAKIQWRVRTAGVTKVYGDWSVERTIDIYAPPTLELSVTDKDGNMLDTLTSFPFYISGLAGPNTQRPVGYHVTITANEAYDTVDHMGNEHTVSAGETVYSKHFDTSDPLTLEISAGVVNLDNNINYTITCVVSMNSGLTTQSTYEFDVAWTDAEYWPNASISIDKERYTASIHPYVEDENGAPVANTLLSVYRRETDGTFTELIRDLDNASNTFITDPHPALDMARYRVVATDTVTGATSFYDIPGYPVGCKAAIIQWDETWTNFDSTNEDALDEPIWTGSMLKLLYNIDVSDKNAPDITHAEYIGRKHPVAYYGTQVGSAQTWNTDIPKSDTETLYALRRLSMWMGNVYVREPSGSGYWASISISFSQKHLEPVIPVTIDITRVSGGV